MNDIVISARDLRKVYRLYSKPHYRFLDMFGMLGHRPGAFTEYPALDGVSLDIHRGEKVAIIGRNGAGKSTFLKLVTGVIEPTSGEIAVAGKVHALLQIGTGFHPDFTGRENIYAYLAQLGVSGAEADRKCVEIIDFAELETYIDQPVKTYSTGMGVRLMFSTSTAITPDLLVLDEVLGVGDAYFSHKSFERMKFMCDSSGTTLLLVTHDIYSAVKLCTRVIWIDGGRVLMEGDGPSVVRAYEDSVRQQEEQRLRARKQGRVKALVGAEAGALTHVLVEVRARNNRPQPSPVTFRRIELRAGALTEMLPFGAHAFSEAVGSHLQREATCWGDEVQAGGRSSRQLLNYGTPFHKVAGVFALPMSAAAIQTLPLSLTFEYESDEPCHLTASLYLGSRAVDLGPLPPSDGGWMTYTVDANIGPVAAPPLVPTDINPSGQYGSGAIAVIDAAAFDARGTETHSFRHGEPFELRIRYQVNRPGLREHAQVLVAFHRNGVEDVCRVITRDLLFDAAHIPQGEVVLHVPEMPLANGTYTVTVMVAEEGYYDRAQPVFYSLNPGVYSCLTKIFEIVVHDGGIVATGTALVYGGRWTLKPLSASIARREGQRA